MMTQNMESRKHMVQIHNKDPDSMICIHMDLYGFHKLYGSSQARCTSCRCHSCQPVTTVARALAGKKRMLSFNSFIAF